MKRKTLIGIIMGLGIAIIGYTYADHIIEQAEGVTANHQIFYSYNELAEQADVIVEITALDKSSNFLKGNADLQIGHTVSEVKVNQVFGNPSDKEVGSIIDVLEPTYTINNKGIAPGVTRYNYGRYTPMKGGLEYVLFLAWDDTQNAYWIMSLEQGKYNIDKKDTKELSAAGSMSQYEALKEDVMKKLYGKDRK
ncbi:hypothetical protein ACP8HI_24490 [Paenibacillus sp. FA6]|uniref:hypothetical protein n=1 Tax=Paenibacillus sp. FA6 TaxID=3413029 RepID=UPI003F659A65